ncbi:MAG: flavodoxin family protein [Leptolyngbyaceae cyanobacterium SL_7_1]|nr:flavodoxin family protein [Leptolyngbyaceae cyanobacterium SL_7_1]
MKQIIVLYHSGMGHTAKMAEAVARGAAAVPDTEVKILAIEGKDVMEGRYQNDDLLNQLDESDAIIFGSPTYMGNVSGQFKCFADATSGRWLEQRWAGKIAAGFTVSGSPSGDKLNTLSYLSILAAQHGMIWVGSNIVPYGDPEGRNQLGSFLGVMGLAAQEPPEQAPNQADKLTGEHLGQRVAEFLARLV